jgi:hypothetical protein
MHNFTLASPPIPNIKFLSFVVSEKAPGVIPHPLPEVNFLMVEIPTLKPKIYV